MGRQQEGAHRMSRRSVTVKDVPADDFIKACADFLKRQPKFDVPKYHDIVKTATFKELAPYDEDWLCPRRERGPQSVPAQGHRCGRSQEVVWWLQLFSCGYMQGSLFHSQWCHRSQGHAGVGKARDDGALQRWWPHHH